ncbi:hypothetical protein H8356DRAFT_1334354 [Neocallimastix lanati (nom. inval.)]|nr:hypothetical protein H8356DRAFT_1334354 [Neocallimastix sp. JGI-2020a]
MLEYLNKTNEDNIVNNNDNDNNNGNNNGEIANESAADITIEETNNAVVISLYGTSVLALVTIIGLILIKKSFISLNYVSPKPNYPLRFYKNNYQSQVSYSISLSDDSPKESPPYNNQEDLLIIKHVV